MNKSDVYELLHNCMGECWEWAYDRPESAVAYFDGLWTMAEKVVEQMEEADKNRASVLEPF